MAGTKGMIGSGGARPGAGGPKKSQKDRQLAGQTKLRERRAALDKGDTSQLDPAAGYVPRPQGLSAEQRRAWDEWAPHALAAHTLTPATSGAFRDFIETLVLVQAWRRKMSRQGWETGKGETKRRHPLIGAYEKQQHRVDQFKLRFMLAPAGRPMEFVPPLQLPTESTSPRAAAGPVDQWDQFDQPLPTDTPLEVEHGSDDPRRPH